MIEARIAGEKGGSIDPADVIPAEENKIRVSAPGSLWSLGKNRVLCADATDPSSYAELTQGLKAAAIVSDPPYNVHIDWALHHQLCASCRVSDGIGRDEPG